MNDDKVGLALMITLDAMPGGSFPPEVKTAWSGACDAIAAAMVTVAAGVAVSGPPLSFGQITSRRPGWLAPLPGRACLRWQPRSGVTFPGPAPYRTR